MEGLIALAILNDYYNSDNHKLYQDRATGTCNGHRKTWRISYNMVSRTSL